MTSNTPLNTHPLLPLALSFSPLHSQAYWKNAKSPFMSVSSHGVWLLCYLVELLCLLSPGFLSKPHLSVASLTEGAHGQAKLMAGIVFPPLRFYSCCWFQKLFQAQKSHFEHPLPPTPNSWVRCPMSWHSVLCLFLIDIFHTVWKFLLYSGASLLDHKLVEVKVCICITISHRLNTWSFELNLQRKLNYE